MKLSAHMRFVFACSIFGFLTAGAHADVSTPPVIGSNMVLQRGASVPIWGSAAPHEKVHVEFQGQRASAVADQSGHWRIELKPLMVSSTPASMKIRGKNTIVLTNILVGEVWLVSGQSNMEFPMVGFPNYGVHLSEPIQKRLDKDLAHPDCGNVRLFKMMLDHNQPIGKTDGWTACNSATLASFSAVGYYFAHELRDRIDVPIGVLESAVGGTRIEPWIPQSMEEHDPALQAPASDSKTAAEVGTLFDKLIAPLTPYALRGVLWYQGEANVYALDADRYTQKMRDLIQGWRVGWGKNDLPFEYALLAPMKYTQLNIQGLTLTPESLPRFWEQQENALTIANTSMISTNDLVDMIGPAPGQTPGKYLMDLIHPGDKWDVAHRFVLVALAKQYGFAGMVASGPSVRKVSRDASGVRVEFDNVGSGLVSRDGKPLTSFEIAGADLKFMSASAQIVGTSVVVSSPAITQPVALRFGWREDSQPNLFNNEGLPALPFRWVSSQSAAR